jgi:hypothetical protein
MCVFASRGRPTYTLSCQCPLLHSRRLALVFVGTVPPQGRLAKSRLKRLPATLAFVPPDLRAREGNRTLDLRITSALLCRLSYPGGWSEPVLYLESIVP